MITLSFALAMLVRMMLVVLAKETHIAIRDTVNTVLERG